MRGLVLAGLIFLSVECFAGISNFEIKPNSNQALGQMYAAFGGSRIGSFGGSRSSFGGSRSSFGGSRSSSFGGYRSSGTSSFGGSRSSGSSWFGGSKSSGVTITKPSTPSIPNYSTRPITQPYTVGGNNYYHHYDSSPGFFTGYMWGSMMNRPYVVGGGGYMNGGMIAQPVPMDYSFGFLDFLISLLLLFIIVWLIWAFFKWLLD